MKIWIHQTDYYPTLNDLRKNYPVLNEYELDEKQDKCKISDRRFVSIL